MKKEMLPPPVVFQTSQPSGVAIARQLRWDLLALSPHHAYHAARLRRIATQLEYAVLHWPAPQWPQHSSELEPVPSPADFLARLATLQPTIADQPRLLQLVRLLL